MATLDKEIKILMLKGETGGHVESVEKTSTSGLVDTYSMNFDDGNSYNFDVTNGSSIQSIVKTSTSGLVDTYTITLTNGTTTTFQVTNGADGEVTTEQLNNAITTAINNIANKTSGSLIGRIINNGNEIRLIVSDDAGINGVLLIIDGTNNKILARKVVNDVIEKEYDLFTEIDRLDDKIDNKVPLTTGTQDDAITYAGLYEIKTPLLNKAPFLISVSEVVPSTAFENNKQTYIIDTFNNQVRDYVEIYLKRLELKFECKFYDWDTQTSTYSSSNLNFTWKLLIKY